VAEALHERGLADTRVADEDDFEDAVGRGVGRHVEDGDD